MDVLSPFIPVVCHSDWLIHGESCPHLDVVHPGHAWPFSPMCTWHLSSLLQFVLLLPTNLLHHTTTTTTPVQRLSRCGYLSEARCILFAHGPADATAIPKPYYLLPHLNPDWFYLSRTSLPWLSWKTGIVVVVVVTGREWVGYIQSASVLHLV